MTRLLKKFLKIYEHQILDYGHTSAYRKVQKIAVKNIIPALNPLFLIFIFLNDLFALNIV